MKKEFNIGIVGCGTVGSSLVNLILENQEKIQEKIGFIFNITQICVKNINKERGLKIDNKVFTSDISKIIDNPEIDIVVELVGGTTFAKEVIEKSLINGKQVVTANKALMAAHGASLFELAKKYKTDIYFEASVAGAIPILLPIALSLSGNKISSIKAILNGTCNYILTKMSEDGKTYENALTEAQKLGFAEAEPSLDVEGFDTMHKLVILASLGFRTLITEKDVFVEGITGITFEDINYARDFGYVIKLLGIAKETKNGIELRVHPAMIPKNHHLATVRNELNAVSVTGNFSDELIFVGKGAGGKPTASSVMGDIINVAQDLNNGQTQEVQLIKMYSQKKKPIIEKEKFVSEYYIKLNVIDIPGVLGNISGILGKNKISIGSVIQKERKKINDIVPLVMLTHETVEENILNALKTINELEVVKGNITLIRIEK